MIRNFDIRLNAAHPELPLYEATAIVGSPSTANIYGVPAKIGTWDVLKVFIEVSYPNGSTVVEEAVKSAQGIWTATVPMCETSGRVKSGFTVIADGIDENGDEITGYILGVADFAVYTRGLVVEDGERIYNLRYFDTIPAIPAKGDVASIDGFPKLFDGYTWLPFTDAYSKSEIDELLLGKANKNEMSIVPGTGADADKTTITLKSGTSATVLREHQSLVNYYTKSQTDDAINALAAYYITYNAAGAAFPTRAALLNATTYYSGGIVRIPTRNDYAVVLADETHGGAEYRYIYAVADGETEGQWEAQYPIETNDYTALANKPQINGVALSGNRAASELGLANLSDLPYPFDNPITTTDGGNKLFDRTVNIVAPETGEFVGLLYPDGMSGRARDYMVYVAPGADFTGAIAFAKSSEYTYFGDDFGAEITAGEKWLYSFTEVYPNTFYVRCIKLEGAV